MSEAQAQSFGEAKQKKLWDHAPGWRNLVVTASLLTTVALALPLMPEPAMKSAAPAAKPRPVQSATLTPVKPVIAPATPAVIHPKAARTVVATHPAAPPAPSPQPAPAPMTPSAQLASAAPQTATPQSSTEPATAQPSNACLLRGPPTPLPQGMGRVLSFEDHATSLARIQFSQSQAGGLIDPAYVDNLRVHVELGNGEGRVLLVPRGMTVNIGDLIRWQSSYRNLSLPCNYVPNLITTDLGPQGVAQQPAKQAEQQ